MQSLFTKPNRMTRLCMRGESVRSKRDLRTQRNWWRSAPDRRSLRNSCWADRDHSLQYEMFSLTRARIQMAFPKKIGRAMKTNRAHSPEDSGSVLQILPVFERLPRTRLCRRVRDLSHRCHWHIPAAAAAEVMSLRRQSKPSKRRLQLRSWSSRPTIEEPAVGEPCLSTGPQTLRKKRNLKNRFYDYTYPYTRHYQLRLRFPPPTQCLN